LRQLIRRLCLAELYFHSIKVNYLLIAVWGKINDKIILISIIRYMKTNLKILTIFSIKNCCNSLHTAYCHVVMSSLHIVMCVYYLLVDYYVYFVYVCMFATTKWWIKMNIFVKNDDRHLGSRHSANWLATSLQQTAYVVTKPSSHSAVYMTDTTSRTHTHKRKVTNKPQFVSKRKTVKQ